MRGKSMRKRRARIWEDKEDQKMEDKEKNKRIQIWEEKREDIEKAQKEQDENEKNEHNFKNDKNNKKRRKLETEQDVVDGCNVEEDDYGNDKDDDYDN